MKLPFKTLLFPAANILVGISLLCVFFMAATNVFQTIRVAGIAALNNLQPQPTDYFLKLYARQGAPDKNKLHCYVDYYEHLLQVFPDLWDAYGMLGYCYHYLDDDRTAVKYLKIAVQNDPNFFWNYYNLAAIYTDESRYQEAFDLLRKALELPPVTSLKKMFSSPLVYLPLLEPDEKKSFEATSAHLQSTYRSSFALMQVLNQAGNINIQAVMRKFKPELYAF